MTSTVLIVDDSLTVRMDLLEAFRAAGFDAVPAATAAEARQALSIRPVDAVVLDVLLPDADGVEFLEELRASPRHRDKVVLMLSTEAEVGDRLRGLRTGADEYVGKPYDTGYLVARARQLLGTRGMAGRRATTVLLIDDSATFRAHLGRALQSAGYRVRTAATGEEGLRLAADERPDAIVVDRVLPGLDGAAVIRRIRLDAALRDVPCLLLTASADRQTELSALDAGADAFARKEEDEAVVLAKLTAILRRADAPAARLAAASSLHGPKKILAVDDDPAIGDSLRGEGYEVVHARSGAAALDLLAAQPVDCILLDLRLPGLDGAATCKQIKDSPTVRDIPLIMLGAAGDPDTMLSGLSAGADDFIHRSAQLDVLKARVRAQIRRKHLQDESRRVREQRLRTELEAAEARAARELAATRAALVEELESKNRELEAFSYSVSHDLRGPLQVVEGCSDALLEDYVDVLDECARANLQRIRASVRRMSELISALLQLSHVSRAELVRNSVDLSAIALEAAEELRRGSPDRAVACQVEPGMVVEADARLMRVLVENLLGNAWKYTSHTDPAAVTMGSCPVAGDTAYFVRDNGAGFGMDEAEKLFRPFGRLHSAREFPGTGIGLATVHRIVDRHGGRIWAEGAVGQGATFFFTTREAPA